jgi:hypothetical protein
VELKQSVDNLWIHAIASKTRALYNTGYSHFERFFNIEWSEFLLLNQICQQLQKGFYNLYIDCLIETVCIVAFFAFLRCGEFSVVHSYIFETAVNLCVEDISLFTDYVILRLKESKTDPFRKGIDIKLFKIDEPICPFSALRKYFSVRKTIFAKNVSNGSFICNR